MSANQQKRAHYHQVAKAKKLVGDQVRDLALGRDVKVSRPVIVEVIWFVPDKRKRDTDGLGPFLKAALDGLVQAGALEDDHSDFVPRTCMSINKFEMDNPRIEVAITEMIGEP
jgi:Holliday junction resolvase RusA-like endonuclease